MAVVVLPILVLIAIAVVLQILFMLLARSPDEPLGYQFVKELGKCLGIMFLAVPILMLLMWGIHSL